MLNPYEWDSIWSAATPLGRGGFCEVRSCDPLALATLCSDHSTAPTADCGGNSTTPNSAMSATLCRDDDAATAANVFGAYGAAPAAVLSRDDTATPAAAFPSGAPIAVAAAVPTGCGTTAARGAAAAPHRAVDAAVTVAVATAACITSAGAAAASAAAAAAATAAASTTASGTAVAAAGAPGAAGATAAAPCVMRGPRNPLDEAPPSAYDEYVSEVSIMLEASGLPKVARFVPTVHAVCPERLGMVLARLEGSLSRSLALDSVRAF